MKKIAIDDFCHYHFLSSLNISPCKSKLAFIDTTVKEDRSDYQQRVMVYDLKSAVLDEFIGYRDRQSVYVAGKNDFLVSYKDKKDKRISTTFERYCLKSKEPKDSFKLPLAVSDLISFNDDYYLILASIDVKCPDYYKYSDARKRKYHKAIEDNRDYLEFDEYPFVFNGAGIINGSRSALFLCDKHDYSLRRITPPTMDVESFDCQNGKILYTGIDFEKVKGKFAKIYEYDVKENKTSILYDKTMIIYRAFYDNDGICTVGTFGKEVGWIENPKFYDLINGEMVLAYDSELSLYNSIGTDVHFGRLKNYAKIDGVPYFISTSGSRAVLYKYANKKLVPLSDFEGTVDDFTIGNDGIYAITTMPDRLQEVVRLNDMKQLTALNDLSGTYVAKPHHLKLDKKTPIDGWVLLPQDFDENGKYPAILDIHGGPKCAYGEVFYHEMQYWANCGYIVFFCNPRGGDGKGNRFADIRRQWGGIDYEDLMDFTDEVIRQYPQIDINNIGVTGGSYGGYMTNWIVGQTNRFRAAATQRSISNWISEVGASDYGIDFPYEMQFTDKNNCHDELWSMSPLKNANNVKTPLLFIHSTEDYRCTFVEAVQFYTALKCRGIETKLVGFKGENHDLSRSGKPKHRIKRLSEITMWMDRHLKEGK